MRSSLGLSHARLSTRKGPSLRRRDTASSAGSHQAPRKPQTAHYYFRYRRSQTSAIAAFCASRCSGVGGRRRITVAILELTHALVAAPHRTCGVAQLLEVIHARIARRERRRSPRSRSSHDDRSVTDRDEQPPRAAGFSRRCHVRNTVMDLDNTPIVLAIGCGAIYSRLERLI